MIKKGVDTNGAENKGKKGGEITEKIEGDVEGEEKGKKEDTGKIGGVGHAA